MKSTFGGREIGSKPKNPEDFWMMYPRTTNMEQGLKELLEPSPFFFRGLGQKLLLEHGTLTLLPTEN